MNQMNTDGTGSRCPAGSAGTRPKHQNACLICSICIHLWLDIFPGLVALTMIVKDEENIGLLIVCGCFDEIVVVEPGRRIGPGDCPGVWSWCSISSASMTYAAARNAAPQGQGDYFWLDADDVIDPPEREKLGRLLGSLGLGGGRPVMVGLASGSTHPPGRMDNRHTCCDVLASQGRTAMAGRRSSIISGCSRSARTCARRTGCMSRFCPRCGGPTCR